ncbi:MAG: ComF family protein [Gemmatimonadaceae bacterium]|nr:ComF family protein [Gemmatimonadaceae bacterium]
MTITPSLPRSLSQGLLQLLLPAACAICRAPHEPDADGIVCGACVSRLVPLTMPQCGRCGHPRYSLAVPLPAAAPGEQVVGTPACAWCARLHPAMRAVRSVARMDTGTGADLVHALKYQGWSRVAPAMARRMARLAWPEDVVTERAALIPVPLSRERRRQRGYNQAELLARALAPHWECPVWNDVLVRTRDTQSQVRLTPSERAGNVSRAFAVPTGRQVQLRGRHLVLVDDVITTAATLNAAADALVAGGARIISCVTFGRAPDPGDRAIS